MIRVVECELDWIVLTYDFDCTGVEEPAEYPVVFDIEDGRIKGTYEPAISRRDKSEPDKRTGGASIAGILYPQWNPRYERDSLRHVRAGLVCQGHDGPKEGICVPGSGQ